MHAIRPSWMPTSALNAPPPDPSITSPPAERHVDHDRPLSKDCRPRGPAGGQHLTHLLDRPVPLLHDARAYPREASGPMTDIFDPRHYEGVRRPAARRGVAAAVVLHLRCVLPARSRRDPRQELAPRRAGRRDPGPGRLPRIRSLRPVGDRGARRRWRDPGPGQHLPPSRHPAARRLRAPPRHRLPLPRLDLPARRLALRLPRHGEDARVRPGGQRPRPDPARHLGRVHLRVLLGRLRGPRSVARRPAGAVRLVPVRDLRAGAPQALRPRLQLEALHRERDGGLPHSDRAPELHRPAGDGS